MNLYPYFNLPKSWRETSLQDLVDAKVIRKDIADTLLTKLKRTPELHSVKVFVHNNAGVICHTLTEILKIPITQIYGIDFIQFFKQTVKSPDEIFEPPLDKRIYFVYNVGKEAAVNKEFSSKLLKGLVQQMLDTGAVVFVQSDLPYSKFSIEYDWHFENKLSIGYKTEERIF